jgi:hypothetical protein
MSGEYPSLDPRARQAWFQRYGVWSTAQMAWSKRSVLGRGSAFADPSFVSVQVDEHSFS